MTAIRRRRQEVAVAGVAGALMLAGCSETQEASDLPTPEVVWVNGEPGDGWWDSEWADAYVNAAIQRSAARAYGDFSDPDYIAAAGYDRVKYEASLAKDIRFAGASDERLEYEFNGVFAFWGNITHVRESDDGDSAWVYGCTAQISSGGRAFSVAEQLLVTRISDGVYRVGSSSVVDPVGEICDQDNVVVAEWADPIDLEDVGRDSVKMPLPREYYVELGVIDE